MDHDKQLAFISNMTDKALNHVASTPNIMTPKGGMSHEKMLSFVSAMTRHGLQHLDSGGTILGGPTGNGISGNTQAGGLAGAVGGALGANNTFSAQATPIQAGTNTGQLNNAYKGAQGAIEQQQNLTNVVNGNVGQGAGAQENLSNLYSQQIQGKGPNPAQAQLNQSTGENIAQQAALQAGQRGAGANAGAIAANAAQQGGAIQQQAVGQAATLNAQQQLAAEQNLQNLSANQISQGLGATQTLNSEQQNEQNILQGANTAGNNANVTMQSNLNNVNAGVAAGNQQAAGNVLSGLATAASNIPIIGSFFADGGIVKMDKGGKVLDANARAHIAPHNFALPGGRYPIHDVAHARNALARVSQNGTPEEKAKVKAAVHRKYPSIGEKKMAMGGEVSLDKKQVEHAPWVTPPRMMMAQGGGIQGQPTGGPQSYVGQWLNSNVDTQGPQMMAPTQTPSGGDSDLDEGVAKLGGALSNQVKGVLNPEVKGASIASPDAGSGASVGPIRMQAALEKGGRVEAKDKGQKAMKSGDSLDNDKVPALLSQGELVVDRDTMADPGPIGQMARAVAQHISRRNKSK